MTHKKFFLYGHTGVGKSTLCASLYNYIEQHEDYIVKRNINNRESLKLIRTWNRELNNQCFPSATKDTFLDVNMGYLIKETRESNGLTFYEVAGEDVVKLDPGNDEHDNKDKRIVAWLEDVSGIIVIAPAYLEEKSKTDMKDISESIQDFYGYLEYEKVNVPICFILSKWDKQGSNDVITFVKENYKTFAQEIQNNKKSDLITLSIGDIDYANNRIMDIDPSEGIEKVFEWIKSIPEKKRNE